MCIPDPGNDGPAQAMISNDLTAVGTTRCSTIAGVISVWKTVIAWMSARPPWF